MWSFLFYSFLSRKCFGNLRWRRKSPSESVSWIRVQDFSESTDFLWTRRLSTKRRLFISVEIKVSSKSLRALFICLKSDYVFWDSLSGSFFNEVPKWGLNKSNILKNVWMVFTPWNNFSGCASWIFIYEYIKNFADYLQLII